MDSQLGRGSCFWFEIPLRREHAPAHRASTVDEGEPPRAEARAMRVLVAEDSVVNQMIVRRMLEHLGCEVEVVDDGLAAVEAAVRDDYDVILMDVEMPRLDGLEATIQLTELTELGDGPKIPVIALTAFAEHRARCFAAGMNGFLAKPVKLDALQRALAEHTSLHLLPPLVG